MFTIVRNGYGDLSSNHEQGCLHFTKCQYSWEKYESNYSPCIHQFALLFVGQTDLFHLGMATGLREGKL